VAITGISKFEVEDYISIRDPHHPDKAGADRSQATIFKLGVLDADIAAQISDRAMVMENTNEGTRYFIHGGTRSLTAVRFGLRDWVNFTNKDGGTIPFERTTAYVNGKTYDVATDNTLNQLPQWLIGELGKKIIELNSLTEELEKN
jgi:hypothetical protein